MFGEGFDLGFDLLAIQADIVALLALPVVSGLIVAIGALTAAFYIVRFIVALARGDVYFGPNDSVNPEGQYWQHREGVERRSYERAARKNHWN